MKIDGMNEIDKIGGRQPPKNEKEDTLAFGPFIQENKF